MDEMSFERFLCLEISTEMYEDAMMDNNSFLDNLLDIDDDEENTF